MGKHVPVVEEGWSFDCVEGDCDHESTEDCVVGVVACAGCLEEAKPDEDDMYTIPEWPCIFATHYGEPAMSDLKEQLLAEWRAKR